MDARLPLNPNLGFYRKAAKDLKRARGITLKDAQKAIAREHGFATWAAFKTAVEAAAAQRQPTPAETLRAAVAAGELERVRVLLAADPSIASPAALEDACDRGLLEVVRLLLDAGADARNPRALEAAAHPGPHKMQAALPVVDLLIARGAPDDVLTHAMLGQVEALRADLGAGVEAFGAKALALAAGNGHVEAVRLLLDAGAPATRAVFEHVNLHIWGANYRAIARLLVDAGVDCTFGEAFEIGHVPAVRRHLAADPSLKDQRGPDGDLPIDRVILRGDVELTRALLDAGSADPQGQGIALVSRDPQRGRDLRGVVFRNCNFDTVNFQSCSFEKVIFQDVDLSGVRINFANLRGVRIDAASIAGMTIWGIELEPLLAEEQRRRGLLKK